MIRPDVEILNLISIVVLLIAACVNMVAALTFRAAQKRLLGDWPITYSDQPLRAAISGSIRALFRPPPRNMRL